MKLSVTITLQISEALWLKTPILGTRIQARSRISSVSTGTPAETEQIGLNLS